MGIFRRSDPEKIVPLNISARWIDIAVDAGIPPPHYISGFPEAPRWGTEEELKEQRRLQEERLPSIEELLADPCVRAVVEAIDDK